MKKRLHCIVSGRVQMVMFRDFVKRNADNLRIKGEVQNKKDGTVFVCAEGEVSDLVRLINVIKKGPMLSRVDDIKEDWREHNGDFNNFRIKYYDR